MDRNLDDVPAAQFASAAHWADRHLLSRSIGRMALCADALGVDPGQLVLPGRTAKERPGPNL